MPSYMESATIALTQMVHKSTQAYFSGHDHHLEHLAVPKEPSLDYVISGAGSQVRRASCHFFPCASVPLQLSWPRSSQCCPADERLCLCQSHRKQLPLMQHVRAAANAYHSFD